MLSGTSNPPEKTFKNHRESKKTHAFQIHTYTTKKKAHLNNKSRLIRNHPLDTVEAGSYERRQIFSVKRDELRGGKSSRGIRSAGSPVAPKPDQRVAEAEAQAAPGQEEKVCRGRARARVQGGGGREYRLARGGTQGRPDEAQVPGRHELLGSKTPRRRGHLSLVPRGTRSRRLGRQKEGGDRETEEEGEGGGRVEGRWCHWVRCEHLTSFY